MLFNTIEFAYFFAVVFLIYWGVARHIRFRNLLLLAASYFFYGFWDWRFLILIVLSSLVDFMVGLSMVRTDSQLKRRWLLATSLCTNLGILIYFKYAGFFVQSFVDVFRLFGSELNSVSLEIILPVGISFYTFQTLSYTIDIYRGKIEPTTDALSFFAFVAFYPQLVAGPIERASRLLPQFKQTHRFQYQMVKSGLLLMAFGLFKKMVIADRAGMYVDQVYGQPALYDGTAYAIATVLFAFQIYCDFSGYSDIAIGTARTMGFRLIQNFDRPYIATSLTEFWHRWHISLSTWFRDYLYIPLGGSQKGPYRMHFNIFLVFLISGLWHGAAWTFVIWGGLHGILLILEKVLSLGHPEQSDGLGKWVPHWAQLLFTFGIVNVAWVFFRAESLSQSILMIKGLFTNQDVDSLVALRAFEIGMSVTAFCVLVLFIAMLCGFEWLHSKRNMSAQLRNQPIYIRWLAYYVIVMVLIIFGVYDNEQAQSFIYFQF